MGFPDLSPEVRTLGSYYYLLLNPVVSMRLSRNSALGFLGRLILFFSSFLSFIFVVHFFNSFIEMFNPHTIQFTRLHCTIQ